jgi:hypothetical protein
VVLRRDGTLLAVESEIAALAGAAVALEQHAPPAPIAAFLTTLRRERPSGLRGIAWFRLPLADDQRSWSATTWRAMLRGEVPAEQPHILLRPGEHAGLQDIVLRGDPIWDTPLPATLRFSSDCRFGDGAHGYRFSRSPDPVLRAPAGSGLLRAGEQRVIGWVRCGSADAALAAVEMGSSRTVTAGRP